MFGIFGDDMKNIYSMVIYDGHLFERFSMTERESEIVHLCHVIDDKEVSEGEWTQRREVAIAHDMAFMRRNNGVSSLLRKET